MAEEMKDLLQNNAPENAEAVTESAAEGTENEDRPKISMPAKEDILYEVDVHMNTSVLYDYMLRHTYTSPGGLIATIIGVFAILFAMKNAGVLYLIAGIVIILYLPWNLYLSAKRQALTNEAFKKPLHYLQKKAFMFHRGIRWKCSTGRICIRLLQPEKALSYIHPRSMPLYSRVRILRKIQ